jgi:toxin ParE1/3/4
LSKGIHRWPVRLSAAAEADFEHIIRWTSERFGDAQAIIYAETLSMAIAALTEGPAIVGTQSRDDILRGLRSLHVAREGRKGSHFILFRLAPRSSIDAIEILRVLHDSMDLARHLGSSDERR